MKKLHVLIPSLVAVSAMPFVGLTSCVVETGGDTPEPVETYVVTLFAGEGTFGDTKQIILSNIKPGTLLKDVEGYKEPTDESFTGWLNNGSSFKDNQPVNANMLLTAKYSDPSVKYKAYVVKTDDKQITLSNDVVTDGQPFETIVEYSGGDITPENISVYANRQPVADATIAQGSDAHHVNVQLTGDVTNGDVVIVVTFPSDVFHSYICNDPSDKLTLTNNQIQQGKTSIGTVTSQLDINSSWKIKQIIINGSDVTNHFNLTIDTSNPKKASIDIIDSFTINGDVLIWFEHDYTVTQEEMESAIKMEGVEYLQNYSNSYEPHDDDPEYFVYKEKFSPTAHDYQEEQRFSPEQDPENWFHKYVVKYNDKIIKYSSDLWHDDWKQEKGEEWEFGTPQGFGEWYYKELYEPIGYSNFTFNEEYKCYDAEQWPVSFYFESKKLVKVNYYIESPYTAYAEEIFTYAQETPPLPFPSDIVLDVPYQVENLPALFTKFWYYDLSSKKYSFTIDMNSWDEGKPTNPESFSFVIGNDGSTEGKVEFNNTFSFIANKDGTPTQLTSGKLSEDNKTITFNGETDLLAIMNADTITCEVTIDNVIENDDYFIFYANEY